MAAWAGFGQVDNGPVVEAVALGAGPYRQLLSGTLGHTTYGIPAALASRIEVFATHQFLVGHQVVVAVDAAYPGADGGVGPALVRAGRVGGAAFDTGRQGACSTITNRSPAGICWLVHRLRACQRARLYASVDVSY